MTSHDSSKKDPLDHIKQRETSARPFPDRSIVCPIDRSTDPRRRPRPPRVRDDGNAGRDVGTKRIKIFPFVYVGVDTARPIGMWTRARYERRLVRTPAPRTSSRGNHHDRCGLVRFLTSHKPRNTHTHTSIETSGMNHPAWIDSTRRLDDDDATRCERRTLAGAGAAASADSPSARTRVDRRDTCVGFATTETERAANMVECFVRRVMPTHAVGVSGSEIVLIDGNRRIYLSVTFDR